MKKRLLRFLCAFCAFVVFLSGTSSTIFSPVNADKPAGKMSSVYGYILNDYILSHGVISTDESGALFDDKYRYDIPAGVVYGDIINFDNNNNPYLVIFTANTEYKMTSCDIWLYNNELETATQIAVIEKNYSEAPSYQTGEFNIGYDSRRPYITYRTYENDIPVSTEFYTVINGEAYMYVKNPTGVTESGVMHFSPEYFRSNVDISNYNKTLDNFFSQLKDTAAGSVTFENIAGKISDKDNINISKTLIKSALFWDFDIARYQNEDEYKNALNETTTSDRFTRLTALYDLEDNFYYATFDTDRSKYNYALLWKSDEAENGYQILKVRTDCIPLADKELKQIKYTYTDHPLLFNASVDNVELDKKDVSPTPSASASSGPITVTVGDSAPVTINPVTPSPTPTPAKAPIKFEFGKMFNDKLKFPVACIGGGIAAALLTVLWVYLYNDD